MYMRCLRETGGSSFSVLALCDRGSHAVYHLLGQLVVLVLGYIAAMHLQAGPRFTKRRVSPIMSIMCRDHTKGSDDSTQL